jgi:hypothetical protein
MPDKNLQKPLSIWILIGIAFLLLLLRSWQRLFYPEVWNEDGTENIVGLVNHGWASLFFPVGGYLILVPKLITLLGLSISVTQYPIISTVLAWAFTIFVFCLIARAPTYLHGKLWLAISCFLLPSDPECFGLPLYTYWWAGLLIFIVAFWHEQKNLVIRAVLLTIGTLSSPICFIALPLFWLRVWIFKESRSEIFLAILITGLAAVQASVILGTSSPSQLNFSTFYQSVPVFFGSYLIGNLLPDYRWIFGCVLLGLFLITLFKARSVVFAALLYLLIASIFSSIYRVDIGVLNPIDAGPRYFFYPFVLMGWLLVQCCYLAPRWLRYFSGALILLVIINAIPHLQRTHQRLHWKEDIIACSQAESYTFHAHFAGNLSLLWPFTLRGEQCKRLLERDIFYKPR